MEASRLYAETSQLSARRMELMTEEMHFIAVKTKEETVSMRIITWVTLFFLPGTFISVSQKIPRRLKCIVLITVADIDEHTDRSLPE